MGLWTECRKIKVYVLFFKWLMWFERRQARRDVIAAAKQLSSGHVPGAVVLEFNPDDIRAVQNAVGRLKAFGG